MANLPLILVAVMLVIGALVAMSRMPSTRPASASRSIVVVVGIALVLVLVWMAVMVLFVGPAQPTG